MKTYEFTMYRKQAVSPFSALPIKTTRHVEATTEAAARKCLEGVHGSEWDIDNGHEVECRVYGAIVATE